MTEILLSLIPVAILCVYSLFFAHYFDKKLIDCLPLAALTITLTLFLCGLFGSLSIGLYILASAAVFFIVLLIIKRSCISYKKILLNRENLLLIICMAVLYFFAYSAIFGSGDDFGTGWATLIKLNYLYDSLAAATPEYFGQLDWPGFTSIFAYYFLKLSFGYREWVAIFSHGFLLLCFLLPLFSGLKAFDSPLFKKIKPLYYCLCLGVPVFLIFAVPLIIHPIEGSAFGFIFVDSILGGMFGYLLFLYYSEKNNSHHWKLPFCLTLFAMFMIKTNGLVLGALAILVCMIDYSFAAPNYLKKKGMHNNLWRGIKAFAVPCICLVLPYFIWRLFCAIAVNAVNTFVAFSKGGSAFGTIAEMLSGRSPQYVYVGADETISSFFTRTMGHYIGFHPIFHSVVPATGAFITLAVLSLLLIYCWIEKSFAIRRTIILSATFIFSIILYLLTICFGFIYQLPERFAILAPSVERYFGSLLMGFILLVISMLLRVAFTYRKVYLCIAAPLAFVLLFGGFQMAVFKVLTCRSTIADHIDMRANITGISRYFPYLQNGDRVRFIQPVPNHYQTFFAGMAHYEALGRGIWIRSGLIFSNFAVNDLGVLSTVSTEDWAESLESYQYVYILDLDSDFIENYWFLFEENVIIKPNTMYRIIHGDNILLSSFD